MLDADTYQSTVQSGKPSTVYVHIQLSAAAAATVVVTVTERGVVLFLVYSVLSLSFAAF